MPSWKGLQIFINIPINIEKLQSSPHRHTEGSNGREPERQKGWRWGLERVYGCLGYLSHNIQEQMGTSITWLLIVKVHSQMYWLLQNASQCSLTSPGNVGVVYVNIACWGNLIKWLKEKVRTWTSTTQSIVVLGQQNKTLSWPIDLGCVRTKQQVSCFETFCRSYETGVLKPFGARDTLKGTPS